MKTFKIGGVHPASHKITSDSAIRSIEAPREVALMLSQSIGKASRAIVKVGQHVEAGEKIAEADGFVSVPLHSPVSGVVKKLDKVPTAQGFFGDAIIITTDNDSELPAGKHRNVDVSGKEIVDIVREAGIVGLGGAAFPTHVKLSVPDGCKATTVLLNGAECEPWLTCDDRLMQEQPERVLRGGEMLMRAVGVERCYVGIESNKGNAIENMRKAAGNAETIVTLKTKYPQGGEKELITAILGVEVAAGALPVSVGAIVDNVATAAAVWDAVSEGLPLTHRVVTVTGPSLSNPGNFLVPLGTTLSYLIEAAGGLPADTGKVIAGGPMMGRAVSCLDAVTVKGLSGLLVLPEALSRRGKEENCIRCARCVDACPMGLEPYLLLAQGRRKYWDAMKASLAMNCIECGSCQYTCPANKPILDYIKLGKAEIRKL